MVEVSKRWPHKKNIGKVAEALAKDPHLTMRAIKKVTWLALWTISNAKKKLSQTWTKDNAIVYIINSSKARLKKIQSVMDRFVDESIAKEKLDRHDTILIKDIANDDMKRITVLWGEITDNKGWLKQIVSYMIPDNGR